MPTEYDPNATHEPAKASYQEHRATAPTEEKAPEETAERFRYSLKGPANEVYLSNDWGWCARRIWKWTDTQDIEPEFIQQVGTVLTNHGVFYFEGWTLTDEFFKEVEEALTETAPEEQPTEEDKGAILLGFLEQHGDTIRQEMVTNVAALSNKIEKLHEMGAFTSVEYGMLLVALDAVYVSPEG